jgi:hypothetical protein
VRRQPSLGGPRVAKTPWGASFIHGTHPPRDFQLGLE